MQADETKAVAHGLTLSEIRNCSVMIRSDDGTQYYPVVGYDGVILPASQDYIDATNVNLKRKAGQQFDGVDFNVTSYNRGWIVITYVRSV